jgi:hypothetical protein
MKFSTESYSNETTEGLFLTVTGGAWSTTSTTSGTTDQVYFAA